MSLFSFCSLELLAECITPFIKLLQRRFGMDRIPQYVANRALVPIRAV